MAATFSYVGVMIYLELTSERQRRKMHQSWSQRVSPEVLKVILNNPSMAQVSGKRLNATVLFTDLQGFTTFCAEAPPEVVVRDLNLCLALVTHAVRRHGGTVHKFIGDGVMAVFGDPVEQPDHALRAVRAACEMQQEIGTLRANAAEGQWVPKLRVGIHTGPLVAGDIGSKEMLEYTVIGDTVSTASRLEGLNKEYGSSIMLSEETRDAAGDEIPTRPLGTAEIRGRPEPMRVFAVDV
jgi:adenylate cyclase